MYDVAEELGMPEHWIEVRHEITHGGIPELSTLKHCSNEAAKWLWANFWRQLHLKPRGVVDSKGESIKDLLKVLLKMRTTHIRNQKDQDINSILKCLRSSDKHPKTLLETAETLIRRNLLFPGQKS
jgi:ribosomal biogenesis protein LAS1